MCGIFGSNNIETFRKLCVKNTERGNFVRSVTYLFPQGLQSNTLVKTKHDIDFTAPIVENPFCIYYLGHVQSPTSKARDFKLSTSHPFTLNGQFLAHNGVLENDRDLVHKMKLENYNDVDSSIILPLMEKVGFKQALEMLQGIFSSGIIIVKLVVYVYLDLVVHCIIVKAISRLRLYQNINI